MLNRIPTIRIERWVYAFTFLHIVVWTLAPTLVRFTLPMDSIEGAIWGQQLEWGYDKNPFMNGWLTTLASFISSHADWGIYFFSQLAVGICFIGVFELGKKIVPPIYAFIAVLMLEGLQYFNLHAIDLNDNTLEPAFWTLTTLFFYQAIRANKLRDWLLTALFAACSMMTKYFAVLLFFPMFLFMLLYPETRALFKKRNVYLGLALFLILIAPHTVWLFSHDFVTINYAANRVSSEPTWENHWVYPVRFAWQQIEVFLPAVVLLAVLLIGRKNTAQEKTPTPTQFDKLFLLFVGIGPFLITILLSAFTGIKLRAGWGQPLLTLWGLTFLAWLLPVITRAQLMRFVAVTALLFVGTVTAYCVALVRAPEPSSANFPGQIIAKTLTREWQMKYHTPLAFVVGPRWLAGNIAYYSKDHPHVYIDANKLFSPWINEANIRKNGALFVWDPTEEYQMSRDNIKKRFAQLGTIHVMHFTWRRNIAMAPVEISVAFLAPEDKAARIS